MSHPDGAELTAPQVLAEFEMGDPAHGAILGRLLSVVQQTKYAATCLAANFTQRVVA